MVGKRAAFLVSMTALLARPLEAQAPSASSRSIPQIGIGHEPIDMRIRVEAGLSPETARGDVEFLDIGRVPPAVGRPERLQSIVAHRTDRGWRVSYVCAESPDCTTGSAVDHLALDYTLSAREGARLDAAIVRLGRISSAAPNPDGAFSCRQIIVHVRLPAFRGDYGRACSWEAQLSVLEAVLTPHQQR